MSNPDLKESLYWWTKNLGNNLKAISKKTFNFGYDWRNNLDNCKFLPIFGELKEITFINGYQNLFDPKISEFVTTDLSEANAEEKFNNTLIKLDKEDKSYEIKLQTLKTERLSDLESREKCEQKKNK